MDFELAKSVGEFFRSEDKMDAINEVLKWLRIFLMQNVKNDKINGIKNIIEICVAIDIAIIGLAFIPSLPRMSRGIQLSCPSIESPAGVEISTNPVILTKQKLTLWWAFVILKTSWSYQEYLKA